MKDLLRRMRFTRTDFYDIVDNPAGSGKAYGAAVAALLVSWLADNGVAVPDDIASALGSLGAAVGVFAVTWIFPNRNTPKG